MKYMIATLGILGATSAIAADLPRKNIPLPPIRPNFEVYNPSYVMVYGGGAKRTGVAGAAIGTQLGFLPINGELAYDYLPKAHKHNLMLNAIPFYRIPQTNFRVYGLAGIGVGIRNARYDYPYFNHSKTQAQWNVGLGAQYDITKNVSWDVRYRHLESFSHRRDRENLYTTGFVVRF